MLCTCIPAVLVAARLVQLLEKLQVPYNASYCTCIPAVLVAARLVQLLKKLQVPARKVHPRQSGPFIYRSFNRERKVLFLFCFWSIFFIVLLLFGCRKNVHFIGGFRNNFQDHRRLSGQLFRATGSYQKSRTSSLWRGFLVRIFRISKCFHRSCLWQNPMSHPPLPTG